MDMVPFEKLRSDPRVKSCSIVHEHERVIVSAEFVDGRKFCVSHGFSTDVSVRYILAALDMPDDDGD